MVHSGQQPYWLAKSLVQDKQDQDKRGKRYCFLNFALSFGFGFALEFGLEAIDTNTTI